VIHRKGLLYTGIVSITFHLPSWTKLFVRYGNNLHKGQLNKFALKLNIFSVRISLFIVWQSVDNDAMIRFHEWEREELCNYSNLYRIVSSLSEDLCISGNLLESLSPCLNHIPPTNTCGHNLKIEMSVLHYSCSSQNIISRVASIRNTLPQSVLQATSSASFRRLVSQYLKTHSLKD